jgi:putative transposase
MTHQIDYTLTDSLIANGLEAIPELVRVFLNNLMQMERTQHIQAGVTPMGTNQRRSKRG